MVSAVDCGPPESPYNGNAVFTSTSYNSVVSYECKYGYILSGEPTRRCGADGKWSGTTPICQGKCKNENLKAGSEKNNCTVNDLVRDFKCMYIKKRNLCRQIFNSHTIIYYSH